MSNGDVAQQGTTTGEANLVDLRSANAGPCAKQPLSSEQLAQWLRFPPCGRVALPGAGAIAYAGQTLPFSDGPRTILACSSTYVIFLSRGSPYGQDRWCFDQDYSAGAAILGARSAEAWVPIYRMFTWAAASAFGGIAPWILFVGETLESVPNTRSAIEQSRRVVAVTSAILGLEAVRRNAPTLFYVLVEAFFADVIKHLAVADVLEAVEAPGAKSVGKLLGGILKKFRNLAFQRKLTLLTGVTVVALRVLRKIVPMLASGAASATKDMYVRRGREIVAYLRQLGGRISTKDEDTIVKEFVGNAQEISEALRALQLKLEALR